MSSGDANEGSSADTRKTLPRTAADPALTGAFTGRAPAGRSDRPIGLGESVVEQVQLAVAVVVPGGVDEPGVVPRAWRQIFGPRSGPRNYGPASAWSGRAFAAVTAVARRGRRATASAW